MSTPVCVLKVMPGVDPCAGAEQSFAATAPGLLAAGVRLHLVVFTDRQGLVPQLEDAGVVVHDLSGATSMLQRVRRLVRVVRSVRPDLIHATLWDAAVPAQLAGRWTRTPVLVTWASVGSWARGSASQGWKLTAVQHLNTALARLTRTEFHAVTAGVAQVNAAGLRVPSARVHVVERGRPDLAPPSVEDVGDLRSDMGLRPDQPVVLAVGRQEPVKNHASLIRSVQRARESSGADVQLLIAGRDGLATPEVRRAAAGASHVHLLGHRDDVPALIEMADVVAVSSLYEGAAGVAIEAMRAGTPIVATDVIGQRGVLVDEINALVVPVDDDRSMSDAIVRVVGDDQLSGRLGGAGRELFEQRFTIDRAVEGLDRLYRQLVTPPSERPLLIGQVVWRLSRNAGVQIVVRRLVEHADPRRVRFVLLSARDTGRQDGLADLGADHGTLGLGSDEYPGWRLHLMLRAARQLRRRRPDVVHLHSGTAWLGVLAQCALPRTPFLLEVHDAPGSGRHGRRTDRIEGLLARVFGWKVVCHSSSVAAGVRSWWSLPDRQISVFPLSVDTDRFAAADPLGRRAAWRSEHGLTDRSTVLLAVGRMAPSKRFDLLVDAVERLVASGHDAHLVLVGDGPVRAAVEADVAGRHLGDRVTMLSKLDDAELSDVFAAADVLVSASDYEGFGLTIIEGMAAGLPVVATAVGGVTDIVEPGRTGELVAAGDAEALVAALGRIASDPVSARAMGDAGRERARRTFGVATMCESFTRQYEALAEGGRG